MSRVNYPMTIDELIAEAVKAKKKFGGNRYILISDDEEANGYHECYFTFGDASELCDCHYCSVPEDLNPEECVTLG